MKNRKRFFSLLTLVLFVISLLAGCSSAGRKWSDDDETDDYGTITRNGKQIDVCICHDEEAIYLYTDNDAHDYLGTAALPKEEILGDYWLVDMVELRDMNDDGNSDLQVTLYHGDMTESYIVWLWTRSEGYVYQQDYSWFRVPIEVPKDDEADFSVFEGTWLGDADNALGVMYIMFDGAGVWQLYSDGESIDHGYLWYDSEDDAIYVRSDLGGAADCGRVDLEGDRLYITTLGNFTHVVSEEDQNYADLSVYAGTWLGDADNAMGVMYIVFDDAGLWQLYSDGESIDQGYLWYDPEDDAVYVSSDLGGAADYGRLVLEGDRLYITTLGNFTHVVSEEDQNYADLSVYAGTWLGDADSALGVMFIMFDDAGLWQLYSDGESIDQGYLWYDPEDDAVYVSSDLGGAADCGRVDLEGDRLYITTLGYFTHIVSEEDQDYGDFSAYEGIWYLDADSSAETYIIIDGDGSWSYCWCAAGEDVAMVIDYGTLSDSGEADIFYADSAVNDGMRYLVFEMDENILIWGEEGAYYRIVG